MQTYYDMTHELKKTLKLSQGLNRSKETHGEDFQNSNIKKMAATKDDDEVDGEEVRINKC